MYQDPRIRLCKSKIYKSFREHDPSYQLYSDIIDLWRLLDDKSWLNQYLNKLLAKHADRLTEALVDSLQYLTQNDTVWLELCTGDVGLIKYLSAHHKEYEFHKIRALIGNWYEKSRKKDLLLELYLIYYPITVYVKPKTKLLRELQRDQENELHEILVRAYDDEESLKRANRLIKDISGHNTNNKTLVDDQFCTRLRMLSSSLARYLRLEMTTRPDVIRHIKLEQEQLMLAFQEEQDDLDLQKILESVNYMLANHNIDKATHIISEINYKEPIYTDNKKLIVENQEFDLSVEQRFDTYLGELSSISFIEHQKRLPDTRFANNVSSDKSSLALPMVTKVNSSRD